MRGKDTSETSETRGATQFPADLTSMFSSSCKISYIVSLNQNALRAKISKNSENTKLGKSSHLFDIGSCFEHEKKMPVLIERTRPTKHQLRAVYAYIRRQREKGKQALAESKAKEEEEKQRKRDEQKKKETVEDVKKEIAELEAKLERLKQKKHDLFSQFKKALNYEDEMRKQRELQAMKAASAHVTSSRGIQGLSTGQGAMTTNVHPQSALVDSLPSSGEQRFIFFFCLTMYLEAKKLYESKLSFILLFL